MPTELACRTCGRPRGENVAEGTRCAACCRRDALILWAVAVAGTGGLVLQQSGDVRGAGVAALVAVVAVPAAFVLAVLLHEATHALAAWLLGQTVTRVLVGEGTARWRIGSDPQLVIGSVPMGNGLTTVMDLRRSGYRARHALMLMAAPGASLVFALAAYLASDVPPPARVAVLWFAWASLTVAVITLNPVVTFGGRVWSDLAATRYLLGAGVAATEEHMLLAAQDRMKILAESGMTERAIETARAAVAAAPAAPLAHGLLAFALHHAGRHDEARDVAAAALVHEMDDGSRAYLSRFLDVGR